MPFSHSLPDWGFVKYVKYWCENTKRYFERDEYPEIIFNYAVCNPDSTHTVRFDGYVTTDSSMTWFGHAFGYDFIECGFPLSELRAYWHRKGFNFLQPGQRIGVCAFVETPRDDWGTDVSPRGEIQFPSSTGMAENERSSEPREFAIHQNYPNPFNASTSIRFVLPRDDFVSLTICDITGRRVRTLLDEKVSAGTHVVAWDGKDDTGQELASGLFFARMKAANSIKTIKLLLVR